MKKDIDEILEKMGKDDVVDMKSTKLSEDEINKIFRMTMDKIEKEEAVTMNTETTGKKHFSKKVIKRVCVAALAATLCTGTIAYAAVHWNERFVRFFDLYGKEETHEASTMEVNKSASDNGITVSAKEVVGDGQGFYLLLEVKGSNKNAFNFKKVDLKIEDTNTYQISDLMCDGIENGTDSYILSVSSPEKLIGKNITLTLQDYGNQLQDSFKTYYKGTWKLNWKLDYEVKTTEYKVDKDIDIYGGKAKFDKVVLSPLSVTVDLSDIKNVETELKDNADPNDTLLVNFMDGSAVNSKYEKNFINDTDKITMYLNRVFNPDEIESITFAGITVPITKNPNPIEYIHYDNKDMGFKIDMPKELDDITTKKESEYYDTDVKAKAKKISFIGTIDGTNMNMFDIIMLKTDISKDELAERNPLMTYLGYANGYVYAINFGESATDEQMKKFRDVENKYVGWIVPRISVYSKKESEN